MARPVLPQLPVAAVLDRMVAAHAPGEVRPQPGAPQDGEGGDEGAAHGPPGAGQRVEGGEGAEGIRPRDVHDAIVVEAAREPIQPGKGEPQRGQRDEQEGGRAHGGGGGTPAAAARSAFRFSSATFRVTGSAT